MSRKDAITTFNKLEAVIIPLDGKRPVEDNWQNSTTSSQDALDPHSDWNIGIVLGDASHGLVDVDLDSPTALALADAFLPETNIVFGRASKRRSHRIYRCDAPGRTKQFVGANGRMIVELRANGGQTMAPSSVHPCGELVEFDEAGAPAYTERRDLEVAVTELAIATELAAYYREGNRHNIALTLSAALCRCGWPKEHTADLIEIVASIFGDNDLNDRLQCVDDSYATRTLAGFDRLAEATSTAFVKSLQMWTGYRAARSRMSSSSIRVPGLDTEADCAKAFVAAHGETLIRRAGGTVLSASPRRP